MSSKKLTSVLVSVVICFIYIGSLLLSSFGDLSAAEKRSLWRIQSKGNVVYLLGSIHYLKPQNYPLDPAMEAAFKDAKKLVFEIDLASAERTQGQEMMVSKAAYTDGTTLKSHVSEKTYALADKGLRALGLHIKAFDRFKPWFIALTVTALKLQANGFDPSRGVDQYFFRKAQKEKKEIGGLETLDYQIDLFDGMPERAQESMLLQSLKEADSMERSVDAVVKAWAAGNLKVLDAALLQGMRDYPELYQRVILDRNREWLPKIESYLSQNENYLVVVGAGHLAGKDGLIEMLKAKGYSVEQL